MASLVQDALDYAAEQTQQALAALGSTTKKETTVWMDGAFDVMHFGHANAFRQVQISVLYLTFGGLWRFHAIDATRVHQTRSWVVSFSISGAFGHGHATRSDVASHRWRRGGGRDRGLSDTPRWPRLGPNGLKLEKKTTHDLV